LCPSTATPPPYIYTLSLHDALPISQRLDLLALDRRRLEELLLPDGETDLRRDPHRVLHLDGSRGIRLAGIRRVRGPQRPPAVLRSEEHTSELQSRGHLVCRLLLEKK